MLGLPGALGKPVVVIMLSGGAVGMEWIASQAAWSLLIPGYAGIFGPRAIARTLFGDVAPSGMLPYSNSHMLTSHSFFKMAPKIVILRCILVCFGIQHLPALTGSTHIVFMIRW